MLWTLASESTAPSQSVKLTNSGGYPDPRACGMWLRVGESRGRMSSELKVVGGLIPVQEQCHLAAHISGLK